MDNRNAAGRLAAIFPPAGSDPDFPWRGPEIPGPPRPPGAPEPGPVPPARVWLDPHAAWQDTLFGRLLERRIVLASGVLDEEAATRISAQLLTLDADGDDPVRLELQNLRAELPAALTLMGALDVMRVPVHGFASGETGGPALGVLASCPRRLAYPHASFTLSEPRLRFGGTVTAVSAREQQAQRMTDSLFYRIAEAAGREADEVREDARRGRVLTVAEAIGYGLIHERAGRKDTPPGQAGGSCSRLATAVMRLDLVTVVVDDYDAAIAFFTGPLGFELAEDSPSLTNDGRPKRWVVVRPPGGGTGLLLARADGPRQAAVAGNQVAGRVGFFLQADDFDAAWARMTAAGVEFVTAPRTEPYGQVAVFLDIAGNRWDLLGPSR